MIIVILKKKHVNFKKSDLLFLFLLLMLVVPMKNFLFKPTKSYIIIKIFKFLDND